MMRKIFLEDLEIHKIRGLLKMHKNSGVTPKEAHALVRERFTGHRSLDWLFFTVFFLVGGPNTAYAIDFDTRMVNQTVGMGVNNGTNRVTGTECPHCGGNLFGQVFAAFGNMSSPFSATVCAFNNNFASCSGRVDPGLPTNFNTPDTQLGKGVPCGPDDAAGPSFPYPCGSGMSLNLVVPGTTIHATSNTSLSLSGPTLGTPGAPFQQITSTPLGDGNRAHHIEFGFDQTAVHFGTSQTHNIFFTIDTVTGPDGRMVGNASGTYLMIQNENIPTNCSVTLTDPAGSGTFTAGKSGAITCLKSDGSPCPGPGFKSNLFVSRNSDGGCQ